MHSTLGLTPRELTGFGNPNKFEYSSKRDTQQGFTFTKINYDNLEMQNLSQPYEIITFGGVLSHIRKNPDPVERK